MLSLVLGLTVLSTHRVNADTEVVDGIEWNYTISGGEASVGNGYSAAISTSISGAITIPSTLGGYPVTSIEWQAFTDCSGLTSVTIPDSVTRIGYAAFANCCGLISLTIPNSVSYIEGMTFAGCKSLQTVVIPNSMKSIGNWMFVGCTNLTSVTIPNSVTSIGEMAFAECKSLMSVTIPNSVVIIWDEAFADCSSLTSLTIPNSVMRIGEKAFVRCNGLTSLTIPNSVTNIGDGAFSSCSNLTSIVVDENNPFFDSRMNCNALIRTLDNTILAGCNTTTIPNSVTGIGNYAFSGCNNFTSMTIPDTITSIGDFAFYCCRDLTSVTIPDSVTSIGYGAFSGCSGLTSVTIPDSVTGIGSETFRNCHGLTSVMIPDTVTSIETYAFASCSGLSFVTIPNSVTNIGDGAFFDCSGLQIAYIPESLNEQVESRNVFFGCDLLVVVFYPAGSAMAVITFDPNGGTGGVQFSAPCGATLMAPIVTHPDYIFSEWSPAIPATVPSGDTTYTAQWRTTYTISFNANGGTGGWTQDLVYDSALVAPVVTRLGYTFAGWTPVVPATVPSRNATYTAQWTANVYTIIFNANEGTWAQDLTYGSPLSAPAVARAGYTFAGWSPAVPVTVPAANTTYVAQWLPTTYKVAFNANGGKGKMASQTFTYGTSKKLSKNLFTRKGYVFIGWATKKGGAVKYKNAQSVKNLRTDGKTTTLYAVWAKKTYKVAFYGTYKGVTGKMDVESFTYGKAKKLTANKFKRKGYAFKGWAKSKALAKKGTVAYKNKQAVKNLVTTGKTVKLYAVWKKK